MKMVSIASPLNEPVGRRLDRTASSSCIQLEEAATLVLESANMMPLPLSVIKPSVFSSALLKEMCLVKTKFLFLFIYLFFGVKFASLNVYKV